MIFHLESFLATLCLPTTIPVAGHHLFNFQENHPCIVTFTPFTFIFRNIKVVSYIAVHEGLSCGLMQQPNIVVDATSGLDYFHNDIKCALFVREGNFSYTKSLVEKGVVKPHEVFTTSFKDEDEICSIHPDARFYINWLKSKGVTNIFHGVDAVYLTQHQILQQFPFYTIHFNYPHHPVKDSFEIKPHQTLLYKFFLQCTSLLAEGGMVRVLMKTTVPYSEWKCSRLAKCAGFKVKDKIEFKRAEFPSYTPKKGFGTSPDGDFETGESEFVELVL